MATLIGLGACHVFYSLDLEITEYGEGPILAMVERMHRESISPDWLQGPEYTVSCYGPVYYWGISAASAFWPAEHSLVPGRLLSLAAALATLAVVASVVRRHTGSIELGLLSAVLLLSCPIVGFWATRHRVDALAMLFAVLAYATLGRQRPHIMQSAACIVVGSLVKQAVAFTAIPLAIYLLLNHSRRTAITYAMLVAILGGAAWSVLIALTGGYYFIGAIQGNLNAFSLAQGINNAREFLAVPAVMMAVLVMVYRAIEDPSAVARSLYGMGFALATTVAVLLSCKEGSSNSYFMEAHALAILVIGVYGLPLFWKMEPARCAAVAALVAVVIAAPHFRYVSLHAHDCPRLLQGRSDTLSRLEGSAGSYVLCDGKCIDLALRSGARPLVNDPYLFRLLVDNGGIEPASAINVIDRGQVSYLVLNRSLQGHEKHVGTYKQKWPPEVLDAMQRNFVLQFCDEVQDLFIYKYRGTADSARLASSPPTAR